MNRIKIVEIENFFLGTADLVRSAVNIDACIREVLKRLALAVGCEWGTYWKVDGAVLRPATLWSSPSVQASELDLDTKHLTLSMNTGTAGHVWRGRKPIWTTDLISDMCLPRSLEASTAGLQGGVWVPLKTDLAVYGVIELLGKNLSPATDELLVALENFGIKIGHLIEDEANLKS